jgi:hypothetical protein
MILRGYREALKELSAAKAAGLFDAPKASQRLAAS